MRNQTPHSSDEASMGIVGLAWYLSALSALIAVMTSAITWAPEPGPIERALPVVFAAGALLWATIAIILGRLPPTHWIRKSRSVRTAASPRPRPAPGSNGNITGLLYFVARAQVGARNNCLYWASRRVVEDAAVDPDEAAGRRASPRFGDVQSCHRQQAARLRCCGPQGRRRCTE